jgi:Ni/Fe-hydrogenase subunit HybB-like protein
LPLIPDVAILRDNLPEEARAWRRVLYRVLALGWRGNVEQWRRLEKAIAIMAVVIIPIAVSVHTIISWILGTTVQPGWSSTIFGPYFVVGAIFSGIAALFLAMTAMRWAFHLEDYIQLRQYRNLGLLLIVMNVIWAYFTFTEHLTLAASQESAEFPVLASKLWGSFAPGFWLMVLLIVFAFIVLVLPKLVPASARRLWIARPRLAAGSGVAAAIGVIALANPQLSSTITGLDSAESRIAVGLIVIFAILGIAVTAGLWLKQRPVTVTVVAGLAILVGMWLERWNIVVPTLTHPRMIPYTIYTPTETEIALTAASLALFALMFMVFFKLFPPVSLWEVAEGRVIEAAQQSVTVPKPEPSQPSKRRFRLFR